MTSGVGERETLLERRQQAIADSGWSDRLRVVQPRNLMWWLYLYLVGYGMFVFAKYLVIEPFPVYGETLIVVSVLLGLYGLLFWWFTEHLDRYARLPGPIVAAALLWGGFAATVTLASPANTPILSLYAKAFGSAWSLDWGAGLTAPFVEETVKGAGLVVLICLASRMVATALDGFVLGAFIGLGFQLSENIQYAIGSATLQFGADPVQNALVTLLFRMGVGVASHTLFSAIFCTGIVFFAGRPAQPRRRGLGVLLMAVAMLMHGVWDDVGGIAGSSTWGILGLMLLIIVIDLVVVVRVYRLAVPTEREFVRAVVAPEVADGVLGTDEVDALVGTRRARRRYRKAGGDRHERRRRRHRLSAALDLAEELGRSGGRDDDERVLFARSELARLAGRPTA